MKIQENILLSEYSAYRIGGPARYFAVVLSPEDLVEAVKRCSLPFFILGSGSNVLFSDSGYSGTVLKLEGEKIGKERDLLKVWAGTKLSSLLNYSLENSLSGLEDTVGVPGSIGGAIRGNAGSFGFTWENVVEKVEFFDLQKKEIRMINASECDFGYRESIFKKEKNWIVLSVFLKLEQKEKKEIEERIKRNMEYKRKVQPLDRPSLGSMFKNHEWEIKNEEYPELEEYSRKKSVPAGFLIEKCGLKGKRIGNIQISEKHGNFFLNLGGGKAKDVIELIDLVKKTVEEKFGVKLCEEIQIVR